MFEIPDIDEKASVIKAQKLLKKYRSYSLTAGARLTDISSPKLDGMPKSKSYGNQVENRLVNHINAETIVNNMNTAMKNLNETSFKVLYYSYCTSTQLTYYQIAPKVGYSNGSIDKLKKTAMLEFAECYNGGELLVYK